MLHNLFHHGRRTALGLVTASALLAGSSAAQNLDYTVSRIDIIQAIPNVTLVGDKTAMVRAHVVFTGVQPMGTQVDGIMRVFVDGVEEPYSPVFSDNGPFTAPENIRLDRENDTLNFIFQPPVTGDLRVTVEVNPPGAGRVQETDFGNNLTDNGSRQVICTRRPRLTYVPIDYRPSGGGANLPDPALIEPGVGDNFIQGMYPTSDWSYRRSDVPSKLWTGNLSGSGSALLSSLLTDLNMMVPQPDFIYGWVPGSLPYNGQANGIPGRAGMGNTQEIRHQRTFAHEIGHLLGRSHIGNTINVNGVDVEHHLNITESLPRIKVGTLFDVMVAGLLTNQAWVYDNNYEIYINRPEFTCEGITAVSSDEPHLLLSGVWHRTQGQLDLIDSVAFRGAIPTPTVPLGQADLIVRVHREGLPVEALGMRINPVADNCAVPENAEEHGQDSEDHVDPSAPFAIVLPTYIDPANVLRVEFVDASNQAQLSQLQRSANAPAVQFMVPRRTATNGDLLQLNWSAVDADGEELKHYLRFSPDGTRLFNLATAMDADNLQLDMLTLPEVTEGMGYFELLSSDGLNTTSVVMPAQPGASQARNGAINPPSTEVLTPDAGMSFPKAATVILHSSGWDMEDRSLSGASIVWTSDVDGVIGTDRLLTVNNLSVGPHVLTVTATDSSGMTDSDSTSIVITDRLLPLSAAVGSRNGGTNPDSYVADAPQLNTTWNATIDLGTSGHTMAQLFLFDAPANVTLGGGQLLLLGGNQIASMPPMAGPIVNLSTAIPNDLSLLGVTLYSQALHFGGVMPFALSNAQDLTAGF